MDNQVLKTKDLLQPVIILVVVAAVLVSLTFLGLHQFQYSDPYVRSVLTLQGNPVQGQAIYQMNCAGCHGIQANGLVGPSLLAVSSRKSEVGIIHQVTSGKTPPMPQFQPSPQAMADLLSYLESL